MRSSALHGSFVELEIVVRVAEPGAAPAVLEQSHQLLARAQATRVEAFEDW